MVISGARRSKVIGKIRDVQKPDTANQDVAESD